MTRSAELADAALPVLALEGVALRRGRIDVLSGLSLEVGPGVRASPHRDHRFRGIVITGFAAS